MWWSLTLHFFAPCSFFTSNVDIVVASQAWISNNFLFLLILIDNTYGFIWDRTDLYQRSTLQKLSMRCGVCVSVCVCSVQMKGIDGHCRDCEIDKCTHYSLTVYPFSCTNTPFIPNSFDLLLYINVICLFCFYFFIYVGHMCALFCCLLLAAVYTNVCTQTIYKSTIIDLFWCD